MNESARTGLYIVIAIVALAVAWWAKPMTKDRKVVIDTGEHFFAQFDPLTAKSMEIVSFNEASSSRNAFKVAQVNGRWSIPSHENYPADAQDHLAQAASSVMDITKGATITDSPADHDLYGVGDPTAPTAGLGSGTRVTLQDEGGNTLVDLIIGKQVKDSQNLRFVRAPGKDRVYTATVDTTALTTKFEDWIERDLLKLNAYQIKDIVIDNYSIDKLNDRLIRGDKLVVHWAPTESKWSMDGLQPGEALKNEKLDQLRNALSDLKIVDVRRKPAGMSSQLAASGNLQLNDETMASLMSAGYYFAQVDSGGGPSAKRELLSNQGEMSFRTSEGVEYTLRFGEVVNVKGSTDLNASPGEAEHDAGQETGRYLFVMANFNPALLDQPKYDPVPDEPAAAAASQPEGAPAASQPDDPATETARKVRQAVIDSNDQKRKDFEKKSSDGQDKVKQLNARFADWYYVVPDSVYQKLKLKRTDLAGNGVSPDAPVAPPFPPPQ